MRHLKSSRQPYTQRLKRQVFIFQPFKNAQENVRDRKREGGGQEGKRNECIAIAEAFICSACLMFVQLCWWQAGTYFRTHSLSHSSQQENQTWKMEKEKI